MNLEHVIVTFF